MRRQKILLVLTVLAIMSLFTFGSLWAAGPTGGGADVIATDFEFIPQGVTIEVGQSVTWTNQTGFHNVVSEDGLFTSGVATDSNWVYTFQFDQPGVYQYYCQPHRAFGMTGTVTVTAPTAVSLAEMGSASGGAPLPWLAGAGLLLAGAALVGARRHQRRHSNG